jgi:hypothetical protein
METIAKRPTIFPKLQREQYADLLFIVPEEVFAEFNASVDRAKNRLQDQLGEALRTANTTIILRDGPLLRRLLAQLRVFLDDRTPPRA